MSTYSELLKDPRWQRKRLEIFERDAFCCRRCADTTKPLNVHHLVYYSNLEPWNYPNHLLITFCENCHAKEENEKSFTQEMMIEAVRGMGATNSDISRMTQIIREMNCRSGAGATLALVQLALENLWSEYIGKK